MRRREFITLLGGCGDCVAARGARAAARPDATSRHASVGHGGRCGVPDLGRRVPTGAGPIRLDHRPQCADRDALGGIQSDDIRRHAQDLAALAPDVILAHGGSTVRPVAAVDRQHTDRISYRDRSSRQRVRREFGAARPQRDRVHAQRIQSEREISGATQRNCAGDHASGGAPGCQPRGGNRRFCRHTGHGAIAQAAGKRDRLARSW